MSACSQVISSQTPLISMANSTQPATFYTSTDIPPTQSPTEPILFNTTTPITSARPTSTSTITLPSGTPSSTVIPTTDDRLTAHYWRNWPAIPTLSVRAEQVFRRGQELGNDLHSFSRIGDCQSVPEIFLGIYDTDRYWLDPDDAYLQSTIDQFSGSFQRTNVTAKDGFGVSSVLTPLMANPNVCQSKETPLECEYRLYKPIIAFIAMGTNWNTNNSANFERYLRMIVDFCLEHGIIPVLVTKADNIEQDYLLNESMARVAYDYDMPLYNTWAAVQYLPNHGLEKDRIYLTTDAWDVRSFAGLQVLDSIWNSLRSLSP